MNGFEGERQIRNLQLMMPLTYNIGLIRKRAEKGLLTVKLGWVLQYNMPVIRDLGDDLPDYSIHRFSNGPVLGLETRFFTLKEGMGLAFNLELYRGSQIYKDLYNQGRFEIPGSSYFKAGVVVNLKPQQWPGNRSIIQSPPPPRYVGAGNQSINQSINQSTNQPINQSLNHSINQ